MTEKMTLYHGSEKIIEYPKYGAGNKGNDFGAGFYCTESLNAAKEWACMDGNDGYACKYTLNTQGLTVLDLNDGKHNILNWVAILLDNRQIKINGDKARDMKEYVETNFSIDYKQYDIIVGYRADDICFSFVMAYLGGRISSEQLVKLITTSKVGEQIVIKSKKAYDALAFQGTFIAGKDIYYPKRKKNPNHYEDEAMQNLGDMMDYAVNVCGYNADEFFDWFIVSGIASEYEKGNLKFTIGMSGAELAEEVLNKTNIKYKRIQTKKLKSKSNEYWAGWIMAYYRQLKGKRFKDLVEDGLEMSTILSVSALKKADVSKFVELADNIIDKNTKNRVTKLKKIRKARGLTQKQLSEYSGVTLRMIQLYEQRQNDIEKAQVSVVISLAKTLGCDVEDILD